MATFWTTEDQLFSLASRELFTAVVGDIMDQLGLHHQFLPPSIRPLDPGMVTIGRAMTVLEADCFESVTSDRDHPNPIMDKPFGLMFEALDDLKPNEVYVCTGASPRYALWGELMSTRAMKLGAVGAVLDGYSRDTKGILALGFPTFSYGPYAQDQAPRGKVIDFRTPIEIAGTRVNPGDIVFGDIDGVCVMPREAEEEIFARALEKVRGEKTVKRALESGMSAKEAFEKYGMM
ncbi:MAG: RraA family protein [Candidatus Bipolaricaulia bacterium]